MTYKATDDDLPDVFWNGKPMVAEYPPSGWNNVAAQVHFPEVKYTARQQREIDRDRRESERDPLGKRKIYVKAAKRSQMYQWLLALEPNFRVMDSGEARFCVTLLAKFRKYTVLRVKWITQPQYQWLAQIAAKYIQFPVRQL